MRIVERIWYGRGILPATARTCLAPAAALYGGATALRNILYDQGFLPVLESPLPVLSVGNLTVGGSGKTPFSAWLAARLLAEGARPAVVLRGYGGDEVAVHRELNPEVTVVCAPQRFLGIAEAVSHGCDVAVLDDGFQHRRLARMADLVLVNVERWQEPQRLLPAGPWRESLKALGRAAFIVLTRRTCPHEEAAQLGRRLAREHRLPVAVVALLPRALHAVHEPRLQLPLESIRGRSVVAVAGVADTRSFAQQLEAAGAVVRLEAFGDHHRFTASDLRRVVKRAHGADLCVCTQKDAVKLRQLWPRDASPLWYVSLRCEVESGAEALQAVLARALASRHNPETDKPAG
jgi:tetraacyldisaccharide 4'-kinase